MKYCRSPEIDMLVRQLVRQGWQFNRGRKHGRLRAPDGRGALTVPGTPSDRRAWMNFRRDVQRIAHPSTNNDHHPSRQQ